MVRLVAGSFGLAPTASRPAKLWKHSVVLMERRFWDLSYLKASQERELIGVAAQFMTAIISKHTMRI